MTDGALRLGVAGCGGDWKPPPWCHLNESLVSSPFPMALGEIHQILGACYFPLQLPLFCDCDNFIIEISPSFQVLFYISIVKE